MMGGINWSDIGNWSQLMGAGGSRGFGGFDWGSLLGALGGVLGMGGNQGDPSHNDSLNAWQEWLINAMVHGLPTKDANGNWVKGSNFEGPYGHIFRTAQGQLGNFDQSFQDLDRLLSEPTTGALGTQNLLDAGGIAGKLARGAATGNAINFANRFGTGLNSGQLGIGARVADSVSKAIMNANNAMIGERINRASSRFNLQNMLQKMLIPKGTGLG